MDMLNGADTAWVMMATALVMLMTPAGLAFLYGGLVQRKSVLNTIGMSYIAFCVATITWVLAGYAIAFGEGRMDNLFFGSYEAILLNNIKFTDMTGTIPTLLFVAFQGTFAAIAIAIISGSIVERVRFSTWLLFCVLWVLFCYAPMAHAVWSSSGWLYQLGELDFAGGTVVHINAGVAGLVVALMLGSRKRDYETTSSGDIKLMLLGSALLWFGWFGFNAGSALAADRIAANALLVTNVAASAGAVAWLILEWISGKKRTLTGLASGAICGLVGITPAAGFVEVGPALLIGFLAAAGGYIAVVYMKRWLRYDDTLDAFGIHGIAGIIGSLCTGLFASEAINAAAIEGTTLGSRMMVQLIGVGFTIVLSAIASFVCFKLATLLTGGGRISPEEEASGIDVAYHGERNQ